MLSAKNINKKYGEREILKDASLEIPEGQIVGIFGDSGIGKSTFAKIICGAEFADSGEYTRLGNKVQMVYQQPYGALDPVQKIGKGFEEILNFLRVPKEEHYAAIRKILSDVDLPETILRHLPSQISGGEAQRVCIARALLFKPKLLVLDEATSMLDSKTQEEVLNLVKGLMPDKIGSVLFISHDYDLSLSFCDRLYILKNKVFTEVKHE